MLFDQGTRLQLWVGPTIATPADPSIVDAIRTIDIRTSDSGQDGFQITFALGRETMVGSRRFTRMFEPLHRVIVVVIHKLRQRVLIDGLVTDQQLVPSNRPGESQLHVTGVDVGLQLDLHEKDRRWQDRSDSQIVEEILREYAQYGIDANVTATTDYPIESLRVPSQQGTDLQYIRELAQRNGFSFFFEPTIPGRITAYWGPERRSGSPQRVLSMNMGPYTNVDQPIHFRHDALRPTQPNIRIADPILGFPLPITLPIPMTMPFTSRPLDAHRTTLPRDTAGETTSGAATRGVAELASGSDAVTATGQVELGRYDDILRPRASVGVRGVGPEYNGIWYVRSVDHHIERGKFTQSFTLHREGHGSHVPNVGEQ